MSVELIAVGTELVRYGMIDTNTGWIHERLQGVGIEVGVRATVDDDAGRLTAVLRAACVRARVVVVTGGLGPTEDDRTRPALASALGVGLERDAGLLAELERRYTQHGFRFGDEQGCQADRPAGSVTIPNPLGSAPGILVERDDLLLAALPGVPSEMRAMFDATVLPRLLPLAPAGFASVSLKIAGRTESSVDHELADLYRLPGCDVTLLGGVEGIRLLVTATGADPAEAKTRIATFEAEVRHRLGDDVVGPGGTPIAAVVGERLIAHGKTVACAESCTGGLLGAALTEVPGSSAWFRGGLIVYTNALKTSLARVSAEALAEHGAVSEPVARQLARGAMQRCGADYGVGITGIAGPGGGTPDKPVGLVHLSIADVFGTSHRQLRLIGDRDTIRRRSVTVALDGLRRRLQERP